MQEGVLHPLQHGQQFGLCSLYPERNYCGADLSGDERAQFSAWYEGIKDKTAWTTSITEAHILYFSEFPFEFGEDGPLSTSHYNIVNLQQSVPMHVSEIYSYYPEKG